MRVRPQRCRGSGPERALESSTRRLYLAVHPRKIVSDTASGYGFHSEAILNGAIDGT